MGSGSGSIADLGLKVEGLGLREPSSAEAVLDNVRAVLPIVAEEADESERLGRMTDRLTAVLRQTGVFEMAFPARRGGMEARLEDQARAVELVSTVDAGIGWNIAVLLATGFYAGRLGDEAYAELYPTRDMPTAGCFWPRGRADAVEGGYLVTGSWQTGSGMLSAPYVLGGCEVFERGERVMKANGEPLVIGVWLKTHEVDIYYDWDVIGMRASASTGYGVTGRFVPERHSFDRYFDDGAYPDPLGIVPELPFFTMAMVSVGIAQHALDLAVEHVIRMRDRGRTPTEHAFSLIGEADSYIRAARAAVYEGVRRLDAEVFAGRVPSAVERVQGDGPVASDIAQKVLGIVANLVGSAIVYTKNPFERLARDIVPISVHAGRHAAWIGRGDAILTERLAARSS